MEYIAIAKNIKIAPRKMRLVADGIKRYSLNKALSTLKLSQKRAGFPLRKALESATANAVNNFKANRENLTIVNIVVDEGSKMKRYHFAARGRTRPYKRRMSHVRVILSDNNIENQKSTLQLRSGRDMKETAEKSKTKNDSKEEKTGGKK